MWCVVSVVCGCWYAVGEGVGDGVGIGVPVEDSWCWCWYCDGADVGVGVGVVVVCGGLMSMLLLMGCFCVFCCCV